MKKVTSVNGQRKPNNEYSSETSRSKPQVKDDDKRSAKAPSSAADFPIKPGALFENAAV